MGFTELPSSSAVTLLLPFLAAATVMDLIQRRIPNVLVVAMLTTGLLIQAATFSPMAVVWGVAGVGVGFLILLPMYALGGMGAGDVKLLAGAGSFFGPVATFYAGLCTLVAGGIVGLLWVAGRRLLAAYAVRTGNVGAAVRANLGATGGRLDNGFPFSLAIVIGTLYSVTLW
jgi:prepilin peptidase CpaA